MANDVSLLRRILNYFGEGYLEHKLGPEFRRRQEREDVSLEGVRAEQGRATQRFDREQIEAALRESALRRADVAGAREEEVLNRLSPGGDVAGYLADERKRTDDLKRREQEARIRQLDEQPREPQKVVHVRKGGKVVTTYMTDRQIEAEKAAGTEFADEPPSPRQSYGFAVPGQEGVFYPERGVIPYPEGFTPIKPTGPSDALSRDVTSSDDAIGQIDEMAYRIRNMGGAGGPLLGRIRNFSLDRLGGEGIDENARFLMIEMEQFLRESGKQYGAALTPIEYQRLRRTVPQATDTVGTLIDKLNIARRIFAAHRENRLRNVPERTRDVIPPNPPPGPGAGDWSWK